jgi:predicted DsbA family dithiol-disulfide isomerase
MDPHCGWCFGNGASIKQVQDHFGDSLPIELLYHFNFEIQPIKKQEFFLWAKKKI